MTAGDDPGGPKNRPLPSLFDEAAVATLADVVVAAEALAHVRPVEVGGTESEVVYAENTLGVHRYEPEERRHETPILLVYALVNRPSVLDLQPDRSVIRRLLEAGFPVYLIDWGEPSRLDATLGMADYVDRYLDNCVEAVRADAGVRDLHVLGYCMGGTLASIYAARNPEPVRTLTCMAMPFACDGDGGILERWATWADPDLLAETYGNVPAELLAAEFAMLDPVENGLTKYVRLAEHADDEAFVETFARIERWIWDGVDVPGAVFREFVGEVYRENRLASGTYELDGEPVDVGAIEVPVLLLVGAEDDLVPPASTLPFADAVGSDDVRTIEFPVGHVGLSVSSRAHEELWPAVTDWLAARGRPKAGRGMSERGAGDANGVSVSERSSGECNEPRDSDPRAAGGSTERSEGEPPNERAGANGRRDRRERLQLRERRSRERGGNEPRAARGPSGDDRGAAETSAPEPEPTAGDAGRAVRDVAREADTRAAASAVDEIARRAEARLDGGRVAPAAIDAGAASPDSRADQPVETVRGIGPTYAGRLRNGGIETVAALRAADPAEIAAVTEAPRSRIADWLDRVS